MRLECIAVKTERTFTFTIGESTRIHRRFGQVVFEPRTLVVRFTRQGTYAAWELDAAQISGPRITAGGAFSKSNSSEDYFAVDALPDAYRGFVEGILDSLDKIEEASPRGPDEGDRSDVETPQRLDQTDSDD